MSKRKPDVYLQDILESIEQIEEYLAGINEEEFYQNSENKMLFFAGLKLLVKL